MPVGGTPVTPIGKDGAVQAAGSSTDPVYSRSVGAPNIATSQAASSISPAAATLIVAARTGRQSVTITNITGTQPVYLGASGVGVATGAYLGATAGSSITIHTAAAIYATSPTAAQTLSVVEAY